MEKIVKLPGNFPAKLVKWKVKVGSRVNQLTIICLYKNCETDKVERLKWNSVGTVKDLLVQEGEDIKPGLDLLKIEGCTHPTVMKDMCAECGADLREELDAPGARKEKTSASIAMVHSVPELIVSQEEALVLGKEDENRLLKHRKLVLLVDLDQTLIHTTNDNVPPNLKDVYHFQLMHGNSLLWYHTKFRPGTEKFLEAISELYELHICTFGVRMYAHTIASYLDPHGKYFSHRILSRDECFNPNSKTANLKALFPCGDSMVCIIDDREDVWNYAPNLIPVKPYMFFDGTADINAPPSMQKGGKDEGGEKGTKKQRRQSKIIRVPKKKHKDKDKLTTEKDSVDLDEKQDAGKVECVETDNDKQDNGKEIADKQEENIKPMEVDDSKDTNVHDGAKKEPTTETIATEGKTVKEQNVNSEENMETDHDKESKEKEKNSEEVKENKNKDEQADGMDVIDTCEAKEEKEKEGKEADQLVPDKGDKVISAAAVQDLLDEDCDNKETTSSDATNTKEGKEASPNVEKSITANSKEAADTLYKQAATSGDLDKKGEKEKEDSEEEYDEIVVWDDNDDYLVYLEDILKRIHTAYYEVYDQMAAKGETGEVPVMKSIIPYVKKKVLKGVNILFSGVVPVSQSVESSRAYHIVKSLGANVQTELVLNAAEGKEPTTHLVAARLGTAKVNAAQKQKTIFVVNPEWLWATAERWERVDERLYPLTEGMNMTGWDSPGRSITPEGGAKFKGGRLKKRGSMASLKMRAKEGSSDRLDSLRATKNGMDPKIQAIKPKETPSTSGNNSQRISDQRRFSETYNPLYAFSDDEIASMDKEVEDLLDSESSDSDDNEQTLRNIVLGKKRRRSTTSEESLGGGEFPKGWKPTPKRRTLETDKRSRDDDADNDDDDSSDGDDDDDKPVTSDNVRKLFHVGDQSSSSNSNSDFDESVGSADEEMAAAVEKEFLSY